MTSCRVATKASSGSTRAAHRNSETTRWDNWAEEKVAAAATAAAAVAALRILENGASYSPIKRKIPPNQNHPLLRLIKVRRDRPTRKVFHRKKKNLPRRGSPRLTVLRPAGDQPPRTHPPPHCLRPSLRMKQGDGTITQRSSSPKMGKSTWHTVGGARERRGGERGDRGRAR